MPLFMKTGKGSDTLEARRSTCKRENMNAMVEEVTESPSVAVLPTITNKSPGHKRDVKSWKATSGRP